MRASGGGIRNSPVLQVQSENNMHIWAVFVSEVHLSIRCAAGAKAVDFKSIIKSLYPESHMIAVSLLVMEENSFHVGIR